MFKKRNIISKLWLKFTDRPRYKEYKWNLVNHKNKEFTNLIFASGKLNNIRKIKEVSDVTHHLNLIHSGNAGDVIYALATIKKIHELTGAAIHLYLRLGKPVILPIYNNHPTGGVMLNQKMADMLIPLLSKQSYISSCEVYSNQEIHIDLDYFRAGLIHQDKGNIARWCGYITGINPDLHESWLTAAPNTAYAKTILIARSMRYRNTTINYTFLKQYPNLKFIGIADEFEDMKKVIPQLEWLQVNDFEEMAQAIAGCKFFIGNQSFPYSVAEALKIPRVLEVAFEVINVVPEGRQAYDFLFQDHFESIVEELYQANKERK